MLRLRCQARTLDLRAGADGHIDPRLGIVGSLGFAGAGMSTGSATVILARDGDAVALLRLERRCGCGAGIGKKRQSNGRRDSGCDQKRTFHMSLLSLTGVPAGILRRSKPVLRKPAPATLCNLGTGPLTNSSASSDLTPMCKAVMSIFRGGGRDRGHPSACRRR